ncbi:hypothetical protein [Pedobacter gandavensis]|uniref:hypothetical protein n=1 Tax=Pedobacter gandavensis TaxID=2679963 RepID=UPI00292F6D37|nr:hypothetical protein [Pedobacter gandavensis]
MKTYLLLPSKYKVFGWILFSITLSLYVYCFLIYPNVYDKLNLEIPGFTSPYTDYFQWAKNNNLTISVLIVGILIGLLMICFSKEKNEDEYISLIRLRSWQWAVLTSYGILIFACLLVYGLEFMAFVLYNMFTILIIFIIKFYYSLFKLNRERGSDEK